MIDFSNTFNTLPTNESLEARKATKTRFIKKENEELKKYAEEIKSSLINYKGIISELISEKSCVDNNNRDETQSIISHRISDMLLSEKKELEKRIRKAKKDISDSLEKAKENEKMVEYWLKKEDNVVKNYEFKIKGCLALSIEKEKIIESEISKRDEMERNLNEFLAIRENEIAKKEQNSILIRKIEGYFEIINQINKHYEKAKLDCNVLKEKNKRLYEEYKEMRDLLKIKNCFLIPQYSIELKLESQKRKECNFKYIICEEKLNKDAKSTYELELENKLEDLKKKLLKYQLKLQSISDEISRQKIKREELLNDQKHLQETRIKYKALRTDYSEVNKENQYPLSFSTKMNSDSFQNEDMENMCNNNESIFDDRSEMSI